MLIAKDFKGPDFTDDEVRESVATKARKTAQSLASIPRNVAVLLRLRPRATVASDVECAVSPPQIVVLSEKSDPADIASPDGTVIGEPAADQSSTELGDQDVNDRKDRLQSDTPYAATIVSEKAGNQSGKEGLEPEVTPSPGTTEPSKPSFWRNVWEFVKTLNTPPTIAVFISFPIALIPRLKCLFVTMPSSPHAPDGLAPLAFVLDTATFIGGASVPLGLICLGSALARLSVPKPWTRLPLGAISMFTIAKLFIMPVLGVVLCWIFTSAIPIINKDDKVLRFVCM